MQAAGLRAHSNIVQAETESMGGRDHRVMGEAENPWAKVQTPKSPVLGSVKWLPGPAQRILD